MDFDEYMRTADPAYRAPQTPQTKQQAAQNHKGSTSANRALHTELSQPGDEPGVLGQVKAQEAGHGAGAELQGDTECETASLLDCSYRALTAQLVHSMQVFNAPRKGRYLLMATGVGILAHLSTFVCATLPAYALGCYAAGVDCVWGDVRVVAYLLLAAVAIRALTGYADQYLQHVLAFSSTKHLRPQLFDACEQLAPHHLDGADASRALSLVTSDISLVQEMFARGTTALCSAVIACILADFVVALHHPLCAVFAAVLQVFMGITKARSGLRRTHQTMLQSSFELEALGAVLLDRMQGMKEIMLAGAGQYLHDEVDELSQKIERSRVTEQSAIMQTVRILDLAGMGGLMGLVVLLAVLNIDRPVIPSIAVVALVLSTYGPCMQVATTLAAITRGLDASKRLERLLERAQMLGGHDKLTHDLRTLPGEKAHPAPGSSSACAGNYLPGSGCADADGLKHESPQRDLRDTSIDLVDVWFAYPESSSVDLPPEILAAMEAAAELTLPPGHPPISKKLKRDNAYVLQMASTHIPAGAITGIKGQSGSGKSTLAQLLMGLHEPTAGILRIGGVALSATSASELRRHIAYVSQDVHLFAGTLADNLRIAHQQATLEELQAALKRVGLTYLIERLDDSIDLLQSALSDGERQRIGIARCILSRRPLIVLDEPTSHLDTVAEAQVLQALLQLPKHATIVLISHRASTLRICDKVCLLRDGFLFEELSQD